MHSTGAELAKDLQVYHRTIEGICQTEKSKESNAGGKNDRMLVQLTTTGALYPLSLKHKDNG